MRRRGLNRIGILAIAMLIALGAVGITYSAWTDDMYIDGSISTSAVDDGLTCGTCSPASGESYVTCTSVANDPLKLTITVKNAQFDVENQKDYYCEFELSNEADSWPVEVTNMSLPNPFSTSGVVAEISSGTDDLQVWDVINPGASATGKVHIYLTDNTLVGGNLSFTLTVEVE